MNKETRYTNCGGVIKKEKYVQVYVAVQLAVCIICFAFAPIIMVTILLDRYWPDSDLLWFCFSLFVFLCGATVVCWRLAHRQSSKHYNNSNSDNDKEKEGTEK